MTDSETQTRPPARPPMAGRAAPAPWAVLLALLPTAAVLGLWVYSAAVGWHQTWHSAAGVSHTLGLKEGRLRYGARDAPVTAGLPLVTDWKAVGFAYLYAASPDGRWTVRVVTVPVWALLPLALVPAALVNRGARRGLDDDDDEPSGRPDPTDAVPLAKATTTTTGPPMGV